MPLSEDPKPKLRQGLRSYGGTSAEQRRLERRAKLLNAAKEVFGRMGFSASTVRMVCEEAGLTERYFYESFANSEALFIAMHKRTSDGIIHRLRAVSEKSPAVGKDRIAAVVNAYYDDILRDPVSARLFAVDAGYISPMAAEVCRTWRLRFGEILQEALGTERTGSAILCDGVIKGLLGIGVDWMESGFASPKEDIVSAGVTLAMALSAQAIHVANRQ